MSLSTRSSPDFLSMLIQLQTPAGFILQDYWPLPTFTLSTISTPQQPALSQRHSGASNSTGHRMRALLFRAKPERAQAPNPSTERDCCEFLRFITPQPPLIHPRQLSTTAPRDSHRPTDARATTSIHLPPFSTSIRNGRRQGYELAQSEDSVIVLLLTHLQERAAAERLAASRAVERLERPRSLTLQRPDSRYALPHAICIAHTIPCHAEAGAPQSAFGVSVADARCATFSLELCCVQQCRVSLSTIYAPNPGKQYR